MFGNSIHSALVHAAKQYDIKESKKRYHNIYALGQILQRIEEVEADIAAGATPRKAVCAAFSDRLLDIMLKAIDEPKHDPAELRHGWSYKPASEE